MSSGPISVRAEASQAKTWRAGTLTYTTAGLLILFFWLLWGDFAWQMKDRSIPQVVHVLLRKFNSSDTFASVLMGALPAALTILIMPVVSYRSDRHRGRWGRRMPFLFAPTPFAALGMACLAFSPYLGAKLHQSLGPQTPGLDTSVLFCIGMSWMVFECAALVVNAIFGALVNDVVPKEVIGRFFALFRALSLIAGMVFQYWLLAKSETLYVEIFVGLAVLYAVGISSMCFIVKEGDHPAIVPMDIGRDTKGFFHAAKTYCQECFGHAYYRLYFLAISISWTAFLPVNLFTIFYTKSIHMSLQTTGDCTALTFLCSLLLAYPLGILVDRFHPLRVGIIVQVLYGVATLLGGLFIRDERTYLIALFSHIVLSGTWMTSVASIGQRLLPKAEFAQFASAEMIFRSVLYLVVGPAVGLSLDHLLGHNYRYTYLMSCGLNLVGICLCVVLYRQFLAFGGHKKYVAPEFVRRKTDNGDIENLSA